MLAILELSDVLTNRGPTNACVALHVHIVAQCQHNGLNLCSKFTGWGEDKGLCFTDSDVYGLEDGNGEGRGFAGTRLGLGNNIATLSNGEDSSLLDRRGLFKV